MSRVAWPTALLVALVALVAGCSSTSPSTPTPPTTRATSASASPSPSALALDGTQLGSALLPASTMPSGYKLDPSGERNTGESTQPDTTQQVSPSKVCSLLEGTSWIDATGIVAGSFAENDYINGDNTAEIAQEADAYSAADAQRTMTLLWRIFGKCEHFTTTSGGTTSAVTMTRSKLSGVGDEAYEAVQTSPAYMGGTTLVAIRVGDAIVTCLFSSSANDKGAAAVTYAEHIANSVKKMM
jgi:hypothetical protein